MRLASPFILFCLTLFCLCENAFADDSGSSRATVTVLKRVDRYQAYENTSDKHTWVEYEYDDRRRAVLKEGYISGNHDDYYYSRAEGYTKVVHSSNTDFSFYSRVTPYAKEFVYNENGEISKEIWDLYNYGVVSWTFSYHYNEAGQPVLKENDYDGDGLSEGEIIWKYDSEGRLLRKDDPTSIYAMLVDEYSYNKRGLLIKYVRTPFQRGFAGRLEVLEMGPWITTYDYDNRGRVIKEYDGAWARTFTYDEGEEWTAKKAVLYSDSKEWPVREEVFYRRIYDRHGNLTVETVDKESDGYPDEATYTSYSLDGKRRISSLSYNRTEGGYKNYKLYIYDHNGRLIEVKGDYSFDGTIYPKTRYRYDENGNIIEELSGFSSDGKPIYRTIYTYEEIELTD